MLVGARLNWLLGHGESPQWNSAANFIQVDIEPTELDSNHFCVAEPFLVLATENRGTFSR